jgi:hypothetical protein
LFALVLFIFAHSFVVVAQTSTVQNTNNQVPITKSKPPQKPKPVKLKPLKTLSEKDIQKANKKAVEASSAKSIQKANEKVRHDQAKAIKKANRKAAKVNKALQKANAKALREAQKQHSKTQAAKKN